MVGVWKKKSERVGAALSASYPKLNPFVTVTHNYENLLQVMSYVALRCSCDVFPRVIE